MAMKTWYLGSASRDVLGTLLLFLCAMALIATPIDAVFDNDPSMMPAFVSRPSTIGEYEEYFAAPTHRARRRKARALAFDCTKCQLHGTCAEGRCICFKDNQNGYWTGENCENCDRGWAGPSCLISCPGGSCNECSGHGSCNQGVTGDGKCVCQKNEQQGYWGGEECARCDNNYFGLTCTTSCPGLLEGQECFGRGTCNSQGDGRCTCIEGWGAETSCQDCDVGHFGADCSGVCVGYNGVSPCSGHGRCFNGTRGNGTCQCNRFYGGPDCSRQCPNFCSNNGDCLDGADRLATCNCTQNWAPPDCSRCIASKTGIYCHIDCLLNPVTGKVCSDNGICDYLDGRAICNCSAGYLGTTCEIACPGSPPCSGHGTCSLDMGGNPVCTCFQSPRDGFWTGPLCSRCSPLYNNSANCTTPCPLGTGSQVCSGHGYCAEGHCFCERNDPIMSRDYCGVACETQSLYTNQQQATCDACACIYCPELRRFGEACAQSCPGSGTDFSTGAVYACNKRGYCDEGRSGKGTCKCFAGFSGTDCMLTCPRNAATGEPCSGEARGICTWAQGPTSQQPVCACRPEFAGIACEIGCPLVAGRICAGHGQCDSLDGRCSCSGPWTGAACNVPCACDLEHGRCNQTACADYLSTQTCEVCECNGNFTGLCNSCKPGNQGSRCDGACVNGTTVGTACQCFLNFSTASCAVRCPEERTNGIVCGGHGACMWGALKSGHCLCDPDWYGPTCMVWCTRENCRATRNFLNPQCNVNTGDCECLNDNSGRWDLGPQRLCDVCRVGFWGPTCTDPCDCNDNGSCDRNTGACDCYMTAEEGFWTGTTCSTCASGYIGERCDRVEVTFTRIIRDVDDNANVTTTDAVWTANVGLNQELFGGGKPLNVYSLSERTTIPLLNSSRETTLLACLNDTGTVVHVTTTIQSTYLVMQSSTICKLPIRIHRIALDARNHWLVLETITLPPSITDDMQVFAVTSQVDTGELDVVPPQMVVMYVARAVNGAAQPGGLIIRVSLDRKDDVLVWNFPPPFFAFNVSDVAISPFSRSGQIQILAVAGSLNGQWDVLMLNERPGIDGELFPFYDPDYSLRTRARCWPSSLELRTCTRDCVCSTCYSTAKIAFTSSAIVLVQLSRTTTSFKAEVAMLQVLQAMPAGSQVNFEIAGRCQQARVVDDPLGVRVVDSVGRSFVAETCSDDPCPNAWFAVQTSPTNQLGLMPVAKLLDAAANVFYLSLRDTVAVGGTLLKFDVSPTRFGIYGLVELNTAIEAMAANRQLRMMYAVSRDPATPVQTYLLYEVREVSPNLADLRGGTNVTLSGVGFRPPPGRQVSCSFTDPSTLNVTIVPANSFTFNEVICSVPRQQVESVTGSNACEGQKVEATIFDDYWFTDNRRAVQRVQRPVLNPIVVPDRGFKDTTQTVTVRGSGFMPSIYSRCKFYSDNPLAREVLFSTVTYVSPTQVLCQQPTAQFASYDKSYIDISLDGQLYSVDTPPEYQIVGDPIAILPQRPIDTQRAVRILNLTLQIWIVDSQRHRLEALDNESRPVYLSANVVESPCNPADFAWRRQNDGYPWPPCRNLTLNSTYWFQLRREREQRSTEPAVTTVPMTTTAGATSVPVPSVTPPASTENATEAPTATQLDRRFAAQQQVDGADWFLKHTTPGTGSAIFSEFYFFEPRVGSARISFQGPDTTWRTESTIVIAPGTPHALRIFNLGEFDQNMFFVVAQTPLRPIELIVIDSLGNIYDDALRIQRLETFVRSEFVLDSNPQVRLEDTTFSAGMPRRELSRISYQDLFLTHMHERSYFLTFSSPGLVPVTTPAIRSANCATNEYKANILEANNQWVGVCRPCPSAGAQCDGTENITVLPGFWRSQGSTVDIYECKGGATVCPGSVGGAAAASSDSNGTACADGHTGPMCALCAPGYGKSGATSCTKCDDKTRTTIYVILIALAFLIAVLGWVTFTLTKAETTDESIIIRTVVNHLQAAGELGEFSTQWSPFLKKVFEIQGGASSFSVSGVQSLDCMLKQTESDYWSVFMGYMMLPAVACGLGVFVFAIVRALKMKPVITKALRDEVMADIEALGLRARTAILLHRYPLYMVLITTLCVTMFTLYQTLIAQATRVLKCRAIVVGYETFDDRMPEPIVRNYLEADMSFSCDTDDYRSLQQAAWLFTAAYGFGIPLLFVFGYKIVNARIAKPQLTKLMFTFLIGGYKEQFWFWQAIIMIRKLVLVCAIVFVAENRQLQSYCAVWTMSVALILQIWFNPNEKPEHNRVEALSLAVITITLNLSLLYFWPDLPPTGHFFLTGALVLITLGVMVMFAYFLYQPMKATLKKTLTEAKATVKGLTKRDENVDDAATRRPRLELQDLYVVAAEEEDGYGDDDGPREIGVNIRNKPRFTFAPRGGGGGAALAIGEDAIFHELEGEPEPTFHPRTSAAAAAASTRDNTPRSVAGDGGYSPPAAPIATHDSRGQFLANRRDDELTPKAWDEML